MAAEWRREKREETPLQGDTTTKSGFNIGVLTSVVKKTDVNICAVA